jgi:hypothetical protein
MDRAGKSLLLIALTAGALWVPAQAGASLARVRPRAFASCTSLIGYGRVHLAATHGVPELSPRPLSEPAVSTPSTTVAASPDVPAPAENSGSTASGTSFSTTNNQEPGVEEPDIVKTDGTSVFAIEQDTLYALSAGPAPRIVGSLPLGPTGYTAQLLLHGSRLLVISRSQTLPPGVGIAVPLIVASPPLVPSPYFYASTTTITEVDVSDPAAMKVARTLSVEGAFVDARQNGRTARLVISSAPRAIATPALRARRAGWIPTRRFHSLITGHRSTEPIASCSAVRRPAEFSGVGMLSIITIDLDRGLYATETTALMADAQVVYGSTTNLYVATQRWINPSIPVAQVPSSPETVIDQFDASSPEHTPLVASGEVPGYLLNQFSLSEYDGYLRVASTSRPIWWSVAQPPASQSYVTVLADHAGVLTQVGQVAGLGAGEQIYSVRFVGQEGYVVTFRRVDPLYTIDLSSPTAPRVDGQLELEGYSSYLHPISEGLLLGIGQEVGPENEPSGSQAELFDVSNPAAPRLAAHLSLGAGSSSQVEYDHHAFLFWAPTALAVLPLSIYQATPVTTGPEPAPVLTPATTPTSTFVGAVALHVDSSGITEVARITQEPVEGSTPQIERSLVIGPDLLTLSSQELTAFSLATLQREGSAVFPATSSSPGASSSPG